MLVLLKGFYKIVHKVGKKNTSCNNVFVWSCCKQDHQASDPNIKFYDLSEGNLGILEYKIDDDF